MITVTYRPEYYALSIDGHAYSGEAGHDLVCSAASMLAQTLAANVQTLKLQGLARDVVVEVEAGKAFIRCTPNSQHKGIPHIVYTSICMGFELLARDYPDNISYEIVGARG